jgi:hypothetical protein
MVTIVKHEWHSHDRQYAIELDETLLSEIYPDHDEDAIAGMLKQIEDGDIDIEDVINEAWNNDIEIEWDFQYDDCWTDRKGGYDVTYEIGDDDSWVEPEKDPEPTHKCTKCRWTGQSYNTLTQHLREDGTVIEDYYSSEEESDITKDVCPMCDSDTELTEVGVKEEVERQERMARWAKEEEEDGDEVECYSCDKLVSQDELVELSGQYHCPHCGEGWVEPDNREEVDIVERTKELENALEELKREFEELSEDEENEEDSEEVQWPFPIDKPNELKPTVKWPFENAIEVDDEEELPEDLSVLQEPIEADTEETLPNYPAGEYTIRVWGRTREIGVGTITKAQYDYWSSDDRSYGELDDALNENYDYEEEGTPEDAQFTMPYYEYQDVKSIWGFDEDDTSMTIENEKGEEIYNGDVASFIQDAHGYDSITSYDMTEETDEMYPQYLGKGTFVVWTQGGKGSCIQTTIVIEEGQEFDPRKFGYKTNDIDGSTIITRLVYDNEELDDEGMDEDNWRGQWSEFNVYENLE